MEGQVQGGIVIASYASYGASWFDILLFDPSKGTRPASIGNCEPCSIRRGSAALQRRRRFG